MFYYISGNLVLLEHGTAVIDAGGVGYKMSVSQTTYDALPKVTFRESAQKATLYTYLAVREDGIELFGFASVEELSAFKMLLTVSGVGPKVALSVLSLLSPEKFALAVCTEDKKTLSKASGVGPKTAARIILELKDKLASSSLSTSSVVGATDKTPGAADTAVAGRTNASDAADALAVLGYSRAEALNALKDIDVVTLPLEDIIRLALKKLMR
jgi:Holliday junction DNA helicase RuvA